MPNKLVISKKTPILFYTTGTPGSGKTSFSLNLAELIGAVHLYADKLGIEIFQEPKFNDEERSIILEEMDWRALNYLRENAMVVYDANNNRFAERERLRNLAKKANSTAIGIWVKTPLPLAKKRVKQVRNIANVNLIYVNFRHQSDEYFKGLFDRFEKPLINENLIIISGTIPFSEQLKALQKQLKIYL